MNRRENPTCGRNSRAKAGKINEAEIGLGALARLPMHINVLLRIVHVYIANM